MRKLGIITVLMIVTFIGIHGNTCSIKKDMCTARQRCKNGGACIITNLLTCEIVCTCLTGFNGPTCENTTVTTKQPDLDNTTALLNYTVCGKSGSGTLMCFHGNCTKNYIKCNCEADWHGFGCDKLCYLDCGEYGSCIFANRSDTQPVCTCIGLGKNSSHEFGPNCTLVEKSVPVVKPTVGRDYWVPVGAVLGVLFLVIALVSVALVILWNKRAIFLWKLVYRFKAYVDEDDKEFDAFISYKSSSADFKSSLEEKFVINTLLPKLERDFGFKICVHFRDFIPGLDITNNVLKAIENSHRTIMLISKAYVTESFWTKFEYQQALVAVMKQKQRIIPILFDGIDDLTITDETLKLILSSTTYLVKPSSIDDESSMNDFWTRLRLSMPKKRTTPLIELKTIPSNKNGNNCGTARLADSNNGFRHDENKQNESRDRHIMENDTHKSNKSAGENVHTQRFIRYLDA